MCVYVIVCVRAHNTLHCIIHCVTICPEEQVRSYQLLKRPGPRLVQQGFFLLVHGQHGHVAHLAAHTTEQRMTPLGALV